MASGLLLLGRNVNDDSEPLPGSPEEAWDAWERRGVAQFRQPHFLHTPVRQLLDAHLPDVKEELLRAGCVTFDRLSTMPQSITDRMPREGDERFVTITGRRLQGGSYFSQILKEISSASKSAH
jgi:hypothetical protein